MNCSAGRSSRSSTKPWKGRPLGRLTDERLQSIEQGIKLALQLLQLPAGAGPFLGVCDTPLKGPDKSHRPGLGGAVRVRFAMLFRSFRACGQIRRGFSDSGQRPISVNLIGSASPKPR